jgi:hypothetical protein
MRTLRRTTLLLAVVVALLGSVVVGFDARADWDPNVVGGFETGQHYECGAGDLPEGPIQGDVPKADQTSPRDATGRTRAEKGYNCGLALLSHATLDLNGRPAADNGNMAWAGNCAYVASAGGVSIAPQGTPSPPPGAGVAVIQVDPRTGAAKQVANLRSPGSVAAAETINAVTTPDGRSILVVGQYGNDAVAPPPGKPMDVYDVSNPDCTKWWHFPNAESPNDPTKATFYWPENIHNLTISANGRYVFGTIPTQAVDISGLYDRDPRTSITYLGDIDKQLYVPPEGVGPTADLDDPVQAAAPTPPAKVPQSMSHEAWPSPDASTLYLGAQQVNDDVFTIVDLRDWLRRDAANVPAGPPRIISQRAGRGHSIRSATVGGHKFLLHSDEAVFGTAFGCVPKGANPFAGAAQPYLTKIDDPAHPVDVSQMGLEINLPENCQEQIDSGANQSVHYHDVDDATNTTFVMASMWNAGVRVFDVRDPKHPTEVAYFNPGDVDPTDTVHLDHAWAHIRYVPRTGQIWFTTADGGFWVVRVERQVLRYLGKPVPGIPAAVDPGGPGTLNASLPALAAYLDTSRYYCTLASLSAGRVG